MSMNVNKFCNDFYLIDLAEQIACRQQEFLPSRVAFQKQVQKLRQKIHENGAKIFAKYLLYAIAGELRHTYEHSYWSDCSMLKKLGIRKGAQRAAAQSIMKDLSLNEKIELVKTAEEIFYEGDWEEDFGGDSWGDIANALKNYLTGEWNDTIFCDRVFDLRHNGGRLFDKHPMVICKESVLREQLDAKRCAKSIEELYLTLQDECSLISPQVRYILKKGEELGYWRLSDAKHIKEEDLNEFLEKFKLVPSELGTARAQV